MYVYSDFRGVYNFHKEDCPFVKYIQKGNRKYFKTYEEHKRVKHKPLKPCAFCLGIYRRFLRDKLKIEKFCKEHNLTVSYKEGMLYVSDKTDNWIILFSYNVGKLALYHKNHRHEKERREKPYEYIKGYHRQPGIFGNTLLHFLDCIANHRQISYERTITRRNKEIKGHERAIPKSLSTKSNRKKAKKQKRQIRGTKIRKVYDLLEYVQRGDIEYTVV